ncbi:MAG: SusF/SusE family outer membrane protein [Prevotellaceae bacterium]|nr:SusF/SusE family outer membrane protein [Prevotellaceae bacterium]
MNKKILFAAAAICLCASCTEDYTNWAEPQSNEAVAPAGAVTFSTSAATASLDLDNVSTTVVKLFNPNLSEGATATSYHVELSNEDASKTYGLEADAAGNVDTEALNKAVVELYSRVREERKISATVTSVAVKALSSGEITVPVSSNFSCNVTVQTAAFAEFFYEIGGETGWSTVHQLWSKEADGKYVGYAYLDGEFKFKPHADDWNDDLEFDGEGKVADNGGSNCPAPATPGLHKIELDLEAMTYSITNFGGVSIIGDATGDSSWGTDIDMEYSPSEHCYTVTTELVPGSFKFRTDHAWNGVNWGGEDPKHLDIDGGNCSLSEGGLYIVRFWPSYSGNGSYEIEAL